MIAKIVEKSINPVDNGIITSSFGSRISPVTGKREFHTGLDIGVSENSKVYAACDGVVTDSGYSNSYGYFIRIKGDDATEFFYAHLNKLNKNKSDKVKKREVIALSGNTGWSTGPHLHYEICKNGTLIDPMGNVEMEYTQEVVNEYKARGEVLN